MALTNEYQVPQIESSFENEFGHKSRRRMLIALGVLLLALAVTLIKDRDFWFPSAPVQSEVEEPATVADSHPAEAGTAAAGQSKSLETKALNPRRTAAADRAVAPEAVPEPANRTALPPLQVEVVAGDEHHPVSGKDNSVQVDLQSGASAGRKVASSVAEAGGQGSVSRSAAGIISHTVQPDYPLLAKQMRVEGSVVLNALIGREGNVQHISVLSGPSILSSAAREAVRQWRFKPYLESGRAVETESRITVNFTIWTR